MLADYSCEIDTRDADEAIAWVGELGVKVIAVGSYAGGMAVLTVQKLSSYYHVPTKVPNEIMVDTDKESQQKLYEKYGLSSIKSWNVGNAALEEIINREETSFVIKPKIGRGSAGILICDKKTVIEYLKDPKNHCSNNMIQVLSQGIEYRCVIWVQKASIQNTIMKADIIVSPQRNIDVIEMDIGVGGGTYYKEFVSELYGKNLMDEYIKLITNQKIDSFNVSRPNLRMDYIFNRTGHAVSYDLNTCKDVLKKKIGENKIILNRLHPEEKKNYNSNADFLFAVIYINSNKNGAMDFQLDDYINQHLLQKK